MLYWESWQGGECLLPSYGVFLCEEIVLRGSFFRRCVETNEHFFPLNKRNAIIGNYSSPPYPKARSRTCCHSLSHAFRYNCLASLGKNKELVVMYAQFLALSVWQIKFCTDGWVGFNGTFVFLVFTYLYEN